MIYADGADELFEKSRVKGTSDLFGGYDEKSNDHRYHRTGWLLSVRVAA